MPGELFARLDSQAVSLPVSTSVSLFHLQVHLGGGTEWTYSIDITIQDSRTVRPLTDTEPERKVLLASVARTLLPQLNGKVRTVIEFGDILDAARDRYTGEDEQIEERHYMALFAALSAVTFPQSGSRQLDAEEQHVRKVKTSQTLASRPRLVQIAPYLSQQWQTRQHPNFLFGFLVEPIFLRADQIKQRLGFGVQVMQPAILCRSLSLSRSAAGRWRWLGLFGGWCGFIGRSGCTALKGRKEG